MDSRATPSRLSLPENLEIRQKRKNPLPPSRRSSYPFFPTCYLSLSASLFITPPLTTTHFHTNPLSQLIHPWLPLPDLPSCHAGMQSTFTSSTTTLSLRLRRPQEQLPFARRELMFYCGAVKWGVLFFLAVASFVMLMWMFFHPTFPLLSVASAAISNVSITAAGATAECSVTLVLTNPNRHLTATYDRMGILLLYAPQEVLLSQFHQPPIVQARRSRITFQTNLSFSGVNLGNGVLSAMKQDFDSGSLGFEMKIFSVIKYRSGKWKTNSHFMRAFCGGVSFAFTSSNRPGIFLNPYQECEVYLYSK